MVIDNMAEYYETNTGYRCMTILGKHRTGWATFMLRCIACLPLLALMSCVAGQGIKEFSSDGCTLFPDRSIIDEKSWCECCFQHDIAYWQGGDKEQRLQADLALKKCVLEKTGDLHLAELMYNGVRVGGNPYFPNWYRWGYGWPPGRNYTPLSPEEKKEVQKLLDDYFHTNTSPVCE